MKERDLQDYLFAHPDVLFPGQVVEEKSREFLIDGKRIDLLFKVDGILFIVELKAVPLQREHIGQVTEYYGRMRQLIRERQIKMILVAPSIPEYRRVFLEELGIRCVEIASTPAADSEVQQVQRKVLNQRKAEMAEEELSAFLPEGVSLSFQHASLPVSRESLLLSHRILRDTLETIGRDIPGYEICPVKMARANSPDVYCGMDPFTPSEDPPASSGGAWWAYSFGHAEEMPKNDLPNVSILMMPWGLDVTINSEIKASQLALIGRITKNTVRFDQIIQDHGQLCLQTWMKLEHQPRFYHWIPRARVAPGQWNARHLIEHYQKVESCYSAERENWIAWIERTRSNLSPNQVAHLHKGSKSMNLAIRLVDAIPQRDIFWTHSYQDQVRAIETRICRLKPLIDFFVGDA